MRLLGPGPRVRIGAAFLLSVVIGLVLAPGRASSHLSTDWYPNVWGTATRPTIITFKFNDQFPNGEWRDRVSEAIAKWNSIQPNALSFAQLASDNPHSFSQDCAAYAVEEDVLYYRDANAAYFGHTRTCLVSGSSSPIKNFIMDFDKSWIWNKYASDPQPGEIDALSAIVHEFGHATGFSGHFNATGANQVCPVINGVPDVANWQTMCDSVDNLVSDQTYSELFNGYKFRRTLETHDQHTFDHAY